MINIKVLYHGNCFDGKAAAWAAWRKFRDKAIYIPVNYGEIGFPPELSLTRNEEVYILDFSYKRDHIFYINERVKKLVVLDHHKTAEKELAGLEYCIFDMNKSGARLAWEYFHPNQEVPTLIRYIEDRDLWRKVLPHTEEINAYIQSFPQDIQVYELLSHNLDEDFVGCSLQGQAIERYKNTMVEVICKRAVLVPWGKGLVPVANTPILMSEVGHKLCEMYPDSPFSAYYFQRDEGVRQWGLRSVGDFDVSEIAKSYGVGGHKNAAGFETYTRGPAAAHSFLNNPSA